MTASVDSTARLVEMAQLVSTHMVIAAAEDSHASETVLVKDSPKAGSRGDRMESAWVGIHTRDRTADPDCTCRLHSRVRACGTTDSLGLASVSSDGLFRRRSDVRASAKSDGDGSAPVPSRAGVMSVIRGNLGHL